VALLPKQVAALPILDWLLSDDADVRATGRTEVLCHAFIRKAIKSGAAVKPFDHAHPGNLAFERHLQDRIVHLLRTDYPNHLYMWNAIDRTISVSPAIEGDGK
jgi:hypothetical protein